MSLEWGDPPVTTGQTDWRAVVEELRARPGEWAKLGEFNQKRAANIAYALKIGAIGGAERGEIQTVTRTLDGGKTGVWARAREEES